ncbi:MAG: hypothetical protein R6U98_22935, partial [Pirellulaceae bacterium]
LSRDNDVLAKAWIVDQQLHQWRCYVEFAAWRKHCHSLAHHLLLHHFTFFSTCSTTKRERSQCTVSTSLAWCHDSVTVYRPSPPTLAPFAQSQGS